MDWVGIGRKATDFISKYRYVLLVLVIGLALMLLPGRSEQDETASVQPEATVQEQTDITDELTQILSQIEGAGKVQVMLTVATGQTTVYQYDEDISNGETGSIRRDTVIITDKDRTQAGLIQQINPPTYQGAIIVCEGAERASVRLCIIEAVSKVTGLGTDRISVLKMK